MLAILAPILVFGLVIFVHELGHFIAAKAVGVYAPRFSIGFGPALFRKRWGETEYVLAVLPLGGYVRMASRLDEDAALLEGGAESAPSAESPEYDPNAMMPFGPLPIPEHRLFESKPLAARHLDEHGQRRLAHEPGRRTHSAWSTERSFGRRVVRLDRLSAPRCARHRSQGRPGGGLGAAQW